MNSNFFKQIEQLGLSGTLQITISKGAENSLVVSTMLTNQACGDKAKNLITPLNVRGSAEELDEGYFEIISTPIQSTSGLMTNMEAYLKQTEEAKKQSEMTKGKSDKEKERDKKYKDAMQKVADLEKAGKISEAISKLPDPAQFPGCEADINKKKTELNAKSNNAFFAAFGTNEPEKRDESKIEELPDEAEEEDEYQDDSEEEGEDN
ncbi:PRTRC system protein E [Emticicia fontis]